MGDRMTAAGRVRLFGAVCIEGVDGTVLRLPSASQRRLVAVLALAGGETRRSEYLCELLDVSAGALRTSVSRLRTRLGEDAVHTDAAGYRLVTEVDVALFEALLTRDCSLTGGDRLEAVEAAIALGHGDVLDEFRHEAWAEAEVARLDEMSSLAVEERAALLIARDRPGEAVAALEAHVALRPLRDRAQGLLAEALAADGRQAEAMRALQAYRALLVEQTGTEPSDEVLSIERRVAAGWHRSRGAEQPDTREGLVLRHPILVPLPGVLAHASPVVGRRPVRTTLGDELDQARSGSLRSVVLSGHAGIGKTTLLGDLARRCHDDGATIVYGRCEASSVPLQPFRTIVRALVEHAPMSLLRDHCEHHGGELQRIAPHLRSRIWVPHPFAGDDGIERFNLFEAVTDLLRRAAAPGPLVLLLDDLHMAEPTALLLLRHIVIALVDEPVLVVATHRGGADVSDDLRAALGALDAAATRRVRVDGLHDDELADLVMATMRTGARPDAEVVASLRGQTAGNPLYVVQLVLHLHESGALAHDEHEVALARPVDELALPPVMVDVVVGRVAELGGHVAEVLRAGSVLGSEVREGVLHGMLDLDEDIVASAVDAAVATGLLVDLGAVRRSFRFTHALVADALYGALPASERRRLHRRAAQALLGEGAPPAPSTVVALARHCAAGNDHSGACRWAAEAGEGALAGLAAAEAAGWYRRALAHARAADRPDAECAQLQLRLGTAEMRAGEPTARETLLDAVARARRAGDHEVLVAAVLAYDRGLMRIGTPDDELLGAVEAALAVVDREDEAVTARLLAMQAQQLVHTPRVGQRRLVARQSVELIRRSGDLTLLPRVMPALQYALSGPDTLAERRHLARRAVLEADATGDPLLRFWASRAAHVMAVEGADPAGARLHRDRMRVIAAELGEPRLRWMIAVVDAFTATMEARLDASDVAIDEVLDLGVQIGDPDALPVYAALLFSCRSFAGRYEELLPLLDEMVRANPDVRPFVLAHAIAHAVAGDREVARRALAAGAEAGFGGLPRDYLWITTVIGYAVLAVDLEEAAVASTLARLLAPYADQVAYSGATSQGPVSAYVGKLASLQGDHDRADTQLRRALEMAVAAGWRYHEASSRVALAISRVRRTGSLDATASAELARAEAIATECGLALVAAQSEAVRRRARAHA